MSPKSKTRNTKLPFVFINMAVTADGKIATANRAVHSFGSARDLEHLYELRATADAILCGARTVEISETTLGNGSEKFRKSRIKNGLAEYPLRVLVSGSGSIDPSAKIFGKRFSPIIILTTKRASRQNLAELRQRADEVKICGESEVNFGAVLNWLKNDFGVKRLLCEGGGELNDALFRANLIDEIHLTICPKIFGGRNAPTISDGKGLPKLALAKNFKLVSVRPEKSELFTTFLRKNR